MHQIYLILARYPCVIIIHVTRRLHVQMFPVYRDIIDIASEVDGWLLFLN